MSEAPQPNIREILSTLAPAQLWAVASAAVVIVLGAFSFGLFVESTRTESKQFEKTREIARLNDKISDFDGALKNAGTQLSEAKSRYAMLETKAEFLNHFLSYSTTQNEIAEKLFAAYVCVMWKQSEERRLHFNEGAIQMSPVEFLNGPSPRVQNLLLSYGFRSDFDRDAVWRWEQITKSDEASKYKQWEPGAWPPEVFKLRERILGMLEEVKISKTVTFFDGTTYEVPESIAIDVHSRLDCAPQ